MSLLTRIADLRLLRVHVDGVTFRLLHPSEKGVHLDAEGRLVWEPALSRAVLRAIAQIGDRAFIDVGGAFGYFSHLASRSVPAARIHAFEPSRPRRLVFRVNNLLNRRRIRIDSRYVGARTGAGAVCLDDYCEHHELVPGVIKMDIEGGEYEAVQGMARLCRAHRPTLLIELHERILRDQRGLEAARVLDWLRDYGYRIRFLDHHRETGEWRLLEQKPNDVNYEIVAAADA